MNKNFGELKIFRYVLILLIPLFSFLTLIPETRSHAYGSNTEYTADTGIPLSSDISFDNITSENGLIDTYIIEVLQDKFGFIWILSETTIARYDGYHFEEITSEEGDNLGSYYYDILDDDDGNIWIASSNGIGMYNRVTSKVEIIDLELSESELLAGVGIRSLFLDSNNSLWFGSQGKGLNSLNLDTNIITQYPEILESQIQENINVIFEDSVGYLWLGTEGNGLVKFDKESKSFTLYINEKDSLTTLSSNYIKDIYEDSMGNLWIGTIGGLNIFSRDTEVFNRYVNDPNVQNSISGNHVNATLEDSSGNIWVGTYDGGINLFNQHSNDFIRIRNDDQDPNR